MRRVFVGTESPERVRTHRVSLWPMWSTNPVVGTLAPSVPLGLIRFSICSLWIRASAEIHNAKLRVTLRTPACDATQPWGSAPTRQVHGDVITVVI